MPEQELLTLTALSLVHWVGFHLHVFFVIQMDIYDNAIE